MTIASGAFTRASGRWYYSIFQINGSGRSVSHTAISDDFGFISLDGRMQALTTTARTMEYCFVHFIDAIIEPSSTAPMLVRGRADASRHDFISKFHSAATASAVPGTRWTS
jgi:hypothetical protein